MPQTQTRTAPAPLPAAVVAAVHGHLQAHLAEPLTVGDLARVAHLRPRQFGARYRASTGQTPRQALWQARMQRAAWWLTQTRAPLAAIAAEVGCADQSHFGVCFKRAYGVTPQQYRDTHPVPVADGLTRLCVAWPGLPAAVQAQIVTLIEGT